LREQDLIQFQEARRLMKNRILLALGVITVAFGITVAQASPSL